KRTVDYLQRTAERAMEAAAYEEAVRATEAALSLVPEEDERTRVEVLAALGWAERALGRFERSIEIWDGVVDAYARLGDLESAGTLLWQIGYQYIWLGRISDGCGPYTRGLELVGDHTPVARADMLGSAATLAAVARSPPLS